MTDPMIRALNKAIEKLGGPCRASQLCNESFVGKPDMRGSKNERLARSTLETWIKGTAKTKARDVIDRLIKLGDKA